MRIIKAQGSTHVERVFAKLDGNFGLTPSMQRCVGVLVVAWGIFECNLEPVIWALSGENPSGTKPTTDAKPVSDWINRFREITTKLHPRIAEVGAQTSDAADDLQVFRNAIVHGWIIPPEVGGPAFVSNPTCFREKRKRATTDAHISDITLTMAIECADILTESIVRISGASGALGDQIAFDAQLPPDFSNKVRAAQSSAHELRHLAAMMNHENY